MLRVLVCFQLAPVLPLGGRMSVFLKRFVINLFKKTDLRITLHNNNTLQKLLMPKTPNLGQIQQIRSIQTNMPGLQQGVCRADGTKFHTRV